MKDYYIGFDIGGTRLKYGTVSSDGLLENPQSVPSQANLGASALYERVTEIIDSILKTNTGQLLGIGLGLTGGVDPDEGVVLLPGKFKELEGFPIVPLLRKKYGLPVWAENDGRLAAYAEKHHGAAKDKDWAVVLTIGTGIGSGVIINGEILHDPNLQFGTQIGHIIMNSTDGRTCLTGNRGTGEILGSSTALALQVRDAIQRGIPSLLSDQYFEQPLQINFQDVIDACKKGDSLCQRELKLWIQKLAIVLINAVHCYAPQVIILSGGATLAADMFLDELKAIVNQQVFRYPKNESVEIVISEIQEYSGVLGAGAMVKNRIDKSILIDKSSI